MGVSYLWLQHGRLERSSRPLSVDESGRAAPLLGATYRFNDFSAVRFAYRYARHARTTAQFGGPSGSPQPVFIWGHYEDNIHVITVAPELGWNVTPRLSFGLAPQLNWVASRGVVSYSTDHPLILLVAPQKRNDEGFTWGAGARLQWSIGGRSALSLGYEFLDLEPSFDREAHVLSGALSWRF